MSTAPNSPAPQDPQRPGSDAPAAGAGGPTRRDGGGRRRGRGGRGRGQSAEKPAEPGGRPADAAGAQGDEAREPAPRRDERGGERRGEPRRGDERRGKDRRTGDRRPRVDHARLERAAAARTAVDLPPIVFPEQLPVSARREDIAAAIRDHQVVIVAGETGSGKTTQLPKIALELGRGRAGQIGHTQPRRIAARTVAERIAEEIGTPLGEIVGYQVRFTDTSSENTLVKVMTDGILLAQIQRDPQLLAYDTLIIDEAHERSLNIDFILGYLTQLLPQRPDLKVIITSATIDSDRFARHFAPRDAQDAAKAAAQTEPVDGTDDTSADDAPMAPVVSVTGRTFPVEVRYRPLTPEDSSAKKGAERDLMTGICDAVDELCAEGPGDILVFLSGEREILDAQDALASHLGARVNDPRRPDHVEIMPLYARLSAAEQHRVFQSHPGRRVVLSTNVAETSLTVPGIRYVVDPGTARISRYSKATKVQRLPIEPIAQASANQRSGRCGRVADGIAIRLYSEDDFLSRPEFTEPEILRTSLASVLLQMISVGVVRTPDDVARFPFVEPPDTRAIRDGVQLLTELGALETRKPERRGATSRPAGTHVEGGSSAPSDERASRDALGSGGGTRLTETGRAIAQLPMDPRLARMIVEGGRRGAAREVMIIAAALSIQDPRERPTEQRAQADQQHARFTDPTSDFLSYLNLWEYARAQQRDLSSSAFRRLCRAEHLNFLRIREWQDVVGQLRDMSKPLGIVMNAPGRRSGGSSTDEPVADLDLRQTWDGDTIHQSLLAGLLSQIGMQEATEVKASAVKGRETAADRRAKKFARNEYLGARGARFAIFPGSGLAKKPPVWVMAGELVETSRLWGRDVAKIQPEWAEDLAAHLVKRTYSEPHWSSKQGAAQAIEKVLLYGVPIVADRKVLFSKVDPEQARELFIRHALVQGEWTTHHTFYADNRRLLDEAAELEARSRQRGLVVDDDALFAFYDERVPASVVSARHFDQWWKSARREDPDLLTFTLDLLVPEGTEVSAEDFPQEWVQGDLTLPLTYQFQPGTDADGVTVHVPISVLNRVVPDGFDWMVPGLLDELTTATIRALPKPVRVQLVPAPDVARGVVAWIRENTPAWGDVTRAGDMAESYESAFTRAVKALRDVDVPEDAWDRERLPGHLRMTFRVFEERGGRGSGPRGEVVLDESKDLVALQRRLAAQSQAAVRSAVKSAVGTALREAQQEAQDAAAASQKAGTGAPGAAAATGGPTAPAASTPDAPTGVTVAEVASLATWPSALPDGVLPAQVDTPGPGGMVVRGYPALVEERSGSTTTVALRVLADASRQEVEHTRGVRRLLLGETALQQSRITSRWSGTQSLTLAASPYKNTGALVADLQLAAVQCLTPDAGQVRDLAAYTAMRTAVKKALEEEIHTVVGHVVAALTAARTVDGEIRSSSSLALLNTLADVRDHVAGLVYDGFVAATPPGRLPHLARYLRAASYRLEKAASNPNRDAELAWKVHDVEDAYDAARAAYAAGRPDPARASELAQARWMIEELRVSLFAQQLGTDGPVSEKRIRKLLAGG
ncbi:ATP-dependent helicase HrpA [Sanguibacter keddieii DSM 10542]|uniref:ATP-dependent helicase HrpA n=1 Tax=Sanguibacter keddieii (strain ATCC 51767 / DSM 10542 / NCFB 3025 / ST-74) TaxID=446469 RepID=D1BIN2_SANKS|nr:ATP-dependent RNA helicase HrpA [Sanguibacter keddieii]ACZ20074.1 ATP-dependent helicase HrpA [Sanguibacter keddieii DSM 10542]